MGDMAPQSPPYIVGLTGGIASGKSSAGDAFARLGADVIDADRISRELVEPGRPALDAVVRHFGEEVLDRGGRLDRALLRARVFHEPAQKRWLEDLLHPLVREEIDRRIAVSTAPYVVLDVPLLLEGGHYGFVDRVLVMDVPEEVQLERALARDASSAAEVQRIIAAQIPRAQRLAAADDIIDNTGTREDLVRETERLHDFYQRQARLKHPPG